MPMLGIDYETLFENTLATNLIASVILLIVLVLVRWLLARFIRRQTRVPQETRRRWLVQNRNVLLGVTILGLIVVWAAELRDVWLSVVAIAAALVIGLKELILCGMGTLVRGMSRAFEVGDRIEIGEIRGDVIDFSFFTTTVVEVGPGRMSHQSTGRAVVIPNALFLTQPIINETYTEEYVLHVFSLPLTLADDWRKAERMMLTAAGESCAEYIDQARRELDRLARKQALEMPPVEPRVSLELPEPGRINLRVRVPVPARGRQRVEQAILRRYLSLSHDGAAVEA